MNKTKITLSATYIFAFAFLWLAVAAPAAAASDIIVSIVFGPEVTSPTNNLQVGDTFTATVRTSSVSDQMVDTWGLYMDFNPAILQVNSVTRLYPINGLDICLVPVSFNNTTGKIAGECTDLGGGTVATNLDVMEIEFQVLQTDTAFDLTFDQVCDGPGNSECFQAISGGQNQIATYSDSNSVPLAITLQTMRITSNMAVLPGIVLVALILITAVVILFYKRQHTWWG